MSDDFTKDEYWYWSTDLSVGVRQVDDDHKALFQLLREAYVLSQKQPKNVALQFCLASELVQYIESLFKRKEAIMLASSILVYENYFSIHKLLVQEVKQELYLIKSGKKSVIDFVIFLRNWFIEYIKNSDQCILEYTARNEHNIHLALEKYASLISKQRCHIYLVDDDEAYINLMQAMVDAAGFKCTSFSSGALFLEAPIIDDDLVVLDLNMPEKDGIEVMRELTEKQLSPAFILISGFDERVLHSARKFAESKQLNVVDILSKPIEAEDFIDTLINVYA
jgi:hemerythrin-like metal-binding protein